LASDDALLELREVDARYGSVVALRGVSLHIKEGEVVAVLGANGSGKTTLINAISGFIRPAAGEISLQRSPIGGAPPHKVVRAGIAQVPQGRDLFTRLTVLDNLRLGGLRLDEAALTKAIESAYGYFPCLRERGQQKVASLSGGEQQMLAIARALVLQPRLMLMDEPYAGLAPKIVSEIGRIMKRLKATGATMLIVEQNISSALAVADRYYVLRAGEIVHEGVPADVPTDHAEFVRRYYL
jgi:branched-chain amino acid transport system ATP-binding protein